MECIQRTVRLIREYKSTPEELLLCRGELDDSSIYFIERGRVELFFLPLKAGDDFSQC